MVSMSFVAPRRKRTLHLTKSLTNYRTHTCVYTSVIQVYVTCAAVGAWFVFALGFSTSAKYVLMSVKISTDLFCSASIKISKRWRT